MNDMSENNSERIGLLAYGSFGHWDVSVNESLDTAAWFLEMDGPSTYLFFQLQGLEVIHAALRFLRTVSEESKEWDKQAEESTLRLGRFGSASVTLHKDNEDFPRCFIVIGSPNESTLRISLDGEDIQMLRDAFVQVVDDLPQEVEAP